MRQYSYYIALAMLTISALQLAITLVAGDPLELPVNRVMNLLAFMVQAGTAFYIWMTE